MSLDQNLFTLTLSPHASDPTLLDLVDPRGIAHYRRHRVSGPTYRIDVYDPLSESMLVSATAPSATSKHKTIELHNPSKIVELKYSGTLQFKWKFTWETHDFEWKREECYILRKPDPAVLVAVTKEPPGRLKTSTVQLLDYNLNRFDIDDRKGLEIVILTALLTFQDTNDSYHTPAPTPAPAVPTPPMARTTSSSSAKTPTTLAPPTEPFATMPDIAHSLPPLSGPLGPPPAIPPKPAPKTGIERIAEMHMVRTLQGEGEANEVEVGVEGTIDDYAKYAENLLNDDAMLFITLRSLTQQQVPKVLAVVEQTKRLRHKSGIEETNPLYQYVSYDTPKPQGPKRINLDDNPARKSTPYMPPASLTIHLSKIDMPELQPRVDPNAPPSHPKPKTPKIRESSPPPMPGSFPGSATSPKPPPRPASMPAPPPVKHENVGGSGKKDKDKEKTSSNPFGKLGLGKSGSAKHKKESSSSAPPSNKLTKPHSSHSPSSSHSTSLSAPSPHNQPGPPRPHSPYGATPSMPYSPWNTGPGTIPGFPSTPPGAELPSGPYPPPPAHPYHQQEPSFYGGFAGVVYPPSPQPPPAHPQSGGYNPGYM